MHYCLFLLFDLQNIQNVKSKMEALVHLLCCNFLFKFVEITSCIWACSGHDEPDLTYKSKTRPSGLGTMHGILWSGPVSLPSPSGKAINKNSMSSLQATIHCLNWEPRVSDRPRVSSSHTCMHHEQHAAPPAPRFGSILPLVLNANPLNKLQTNWWSKHTHLYMIPLCTLQLHPLALDLLLAWSCHQLQLQGPGWSTARTHLDARWMVPDRRRGWLASVAFYPDQLTKPITDACMHLAMKD